jgi:hypothetical protein
MRELEISHESGGLNTRALRYEGAKKPEQQVWRAAAVVTEAESEALGWRLETGGRGQQAVGSRRARPAAY